MPDLSLALSNNSLARPAAVPARASEYESFYGLLEAPFSVTPGLRFAYPSRSYQSALEEVRHGLQRGHGLIVVTGEAGTGKTLLCRALLEGSDARTFMSVVLDPCATVEELLVQVLTDFGVLNATRTAPGTRQELVALLQRFLASLVRSGARAVIVMEEAQHLHPAMFEQLRLWSNFETNDAKLLQIVLVGQPALEDVLRRPEMQQIAQRATHRVKLSSLDSDEIGGYIDHRLAVASGCGEPTPGVPMLALPMPGMLGQAELWRVQFTPAAVRAIASASRGTPRLVNALCDRALEIGCERRTMKIDARVIRHAARSVDAAARWTMPRTTSARVGGVAAVLALLVMVPAVWARVGGASSTRFGHGDSAPAAASATAGAANPVTDRVGAGDIPAESPQVTGTLAVSDSVTITVAAFNTQQRAAAVAAQLVDEGFPAFSRSDADGLVHQVIVGPYVTADEAAAAKRALAAHGVAAAEVRLDRARLDR